MCAVLISHTVSLMAAVAFLYGALTSTRLSPSVPHQIYSMIHVSFKFCATAPDRFKHPLCIQIMGILGWMKSHPSIPCCEHSSSFCRVHRVNVGTQRTAKNIFQKLQKIKPSRANGNRFTRNEANDCWKTTTTSRTCSRISNA